MSRARALPWVLLLAACDPKQEASDLAQRASAQANALGQDVKSATEAHVQNGVSAAKRALFGLTDSGALSAAASQWLGGDAPPDGSIEATIKRGAQLAPVAFEAALVLNRAVDEDTAIEPIFQKVAPGDQAKVDASIAGMPRVEVVEGVTIGFKKLDAIETTKITKEQAVLVTWRRGDHLVGFVYRSKKTIDLEVLVKETPRLVTLTESALK